VASIPDTPLPQPSFDWVTHGNKPTQPFAQYMAKLDACVRALAGGLFGSPTQLINAANDGAAAVAGVRIGQAYRNGSVLMIRVT
jgi:hypothetical protein